MRNKSIILAVTISLVCLSFFVIQRPTAEAKEIKINEVAADKAIIMGDLCFDSSVATNCKTSWSDVISGISNWTVSGTNIYNKNLGNVGIGAANFTQKLTVSNNILLGSVVSGLTATPSYLDLGSNYSNGTTRDKLKIYLYNSGTEQYGFSVGSASDIQYHSNGIHEFYVGNASKVIINSAGNVGIGTTAVPFPLTVNGTISTYSQQLIQARYTNSDTYAGSLWWNQLTLGNNGPNYIVAGRQTAGGALYFNVNNTSTTQGSPNGTNAIVIQPSGYVGINKVDPGSSLDVNGLIKMRTSTIVAAEDVIRKDYLDAYIPLNATNAANAANADKLDGYHETSFLRLAPNSSSPTNGNFAMGTDGTRNFIQSHLSRPLDLNPLGNAVTINGNTPVTSGNIASQSVSHAETADSATNLVNFSVAHGVNPDTKGTTGIHYFAGGATSPYSDGTLIQQAYQSAPTTWGSQIMQDYRTGRLAVRGLNNTAWTTWLNIIDSGNIASQSVLHAETADSATDSTKVAKTGDTMTGNLYFNNYGLGVIGTYSADRYQAVFAMGDSYKLPVGGDTTGNLYGLAWSHPNAGGIAANLSSHGLLVMENGGFLAAISGSIRARDDMRAPVFYDSNDTGYYVNPAGASNFNSLTRQSNTITAGPDVINKNYLDSALAGIVHPDTSPTNEIQTLGTSGNNITLSQGGSATVKDTITAPYATSAGTFSTDRSSYKGVTDGAVAGQLMWKNYGNGHTIFDASNSTSPSGTAVNNTNAQIAWSATYPTLMGWNGTNTYGVRVDSARVADSATDSTKVLKAGDTMTGGLTVNVGSRPITVGATGGMITSQGDTGGWAFGYHAKGSSGTDRGGFGFYGQADALTYYYIGNSFSSPTVTVQPSNGKVGIGTNDPGAKLNVVNTTGGDGTYTGGISVQNTNATDGEPTISFSNNSNGTSRWLVGQNQDANFHINYGTTFADANNFLYINTAGNTGLGTAGAEPGARLDVNGLIKMRTSTITAAEDVINKGYLNAYVFSETDPQVGTVTAGKWCIADGTAINCTVTPVVDTNTDAQQLGTAGNTITLTNGGSITAPYATNAGNADTVDSKHIGTVTTGQWCTATNGTTISCTTAAPNSMVYPGAGIANSTGSAWGASYATTGSGSVVLSSSPSVTDIFSTGWFRNYARAGFYNQTYGTHLYTDGYSYWRMSSNSGLMFNSTTDYDSAAAGYIYHDATGFGLLHSGGGWAIRTAPASDTIYIPGAVGIGIATPNAKLQVVGSSNFVPVAGSSLKIESSSASTPRIQSYNSQALYINEIGNNVIFNTTSGNVGIGVPNPLYKLHVSGEIRSNDKVSAPSLCIGADCKNAWPTLPASSDSYDADATFTSVHTVSVTATGNVQASTLNVTGATINAAAANISANSMSLSGGFTASGVSADAQGSFSANNIILSNLTGNTVITGNLGMFLLNQGGTNAIAMSGSHVYIGNGSPSSNETLVVGNGTHYYDSDSGHDTTRSIVAKGGIKIEQVDPGDSALYIAGAPADLSILARGRVVGASWTNSDRTLKTNIKTVSDPLDKIMKLRGVSFNWKDGGAPSLGVIAQEVEPVFPELVSVVDGKMAVQYDGFIGPLIEAVKAQQEEIKGLQKRIEILETQR